MVMDTAGRTSVGFALRSASLVLLGCAAQSAPPAPSNLNCIHGQPGQLIAQVDVDPMSVDVVSFMAARADDPEKWPFVQYSVPVRLSDKSTISGTIPGLEAGVEYLLMARAHARNQTTGYFIFWSDVAHKEDPCTAALTVAAAPEAHTGATTDTMWIEVFRHNGNNYWSTPDPQNNITLPDYIDAHNTGDLAGVFYHPQAVVYSWETNSSFTRYCVEMQVVELHNVTTPTDRPDDREAGGFPTTSTFADYNSCSGGNCFCMAYGDRSFRQPQKQLDEECPGCSTAECMCRCPAERLAQSSKYIGMVPTGTHVENGEVVIDGRWYSMPPGGSCAPGASIGDDGCTYQLSPLSHSLSLGNLNNKGVFREDLRSDQWLQIARSAFDDLGIEPCGSASSTINERVLI